MEKRRITPYILAIISTVLVTFSGCSEDFFDQKAGDRITPDQHYQTIIDAQISSMGAIIPLQDIMPRFIMLDGLRSDMMDVTPNSNSYFHDINQQIFTPGNPYTNPADFYKVIINLNEVLANIDEIALKDRNLDDFILHYVKGAFIGMRSWTYLTLVRLYGKAAYIEDNLLSLPSDLSQNVMSKEVMIDTLINQITPYIHDNTLGTEFVELKLDYYVNTKALLGELYLEKNDYVKAAEYLKLACESYGDNPIMLKVDQTYKDAGWSTIFLNAEGQGLENLCVIPFSSIENQSNPLASWLGHDFEYQAKPSMVLIDSFMAQIPAAGSPGDLWRGKGTTFNADTLTWLTDTTFIIEPYITKYEIDRSDPFSSDIVISRAADIHLLLAEALNRIGDETSQEYALMLLNQGVNKENPKPPTYSRWSRNLGIRGRVYLNSKELPETLPPDSITLWIEDFIIAERALELAYEGKRWFDLVRIAERRDEPEFLADKVAAKFEGTPMYDEIRNKLMNPANWYLPFE
ncbi:MAG: RagB/SusD family nutrient uptake outer membrane protein [Bacteroidales bacterium]|nr:RagB/SusD family nutrient uptake outer membrane protein [Bacteroidales bacterium]